MSKLFFQLRAELQILADVFFVAVRRRRVIFRALHFSGQIILFDDMVRVIVRVFVVYAVAELGGSLVMAVAQMDRNRTAVFGAHIGERLVDSEIAGIAFRRAGDVRYGLCQWNSRFRHADDCTAAIATTSACGSALPTSSEAQMAMRRAMKFTSSPAASILAR